MLFSAVLGAAVYHLNHFKLWITLSLQVFYLCSPLSTLASVHIRTFCLLGGSMCLGNSPRAGSHRLGTRMKSASSRPH
ncbi:hypothetical protein C8R44DRAFT_775405 [Mycena epipterygia]|nr:hypothetical protein C8R44DRAFT_775405 [Mycena epipterygia]